MSREKATERISRSTNSRQQKRSYIGIILVILLLIFIVLIAILLVTRKDSGDKEIERFNLVVTPDNVEQIVEQLENANRTPVGSYEARMNTEWSFPDGKSASTNAYVENVANNQHTVYYTIALKESPDEIIMKSPYMPIGSYMENIKLDTPLKKGVYEAILTYHMLDNDYKEMGTLSVTVILTIVN